MKKNIQSWHDFMVKGWRVFDIHWLILVTGTVKTLGWAGAAFRGAGKHEFHVWPDKGVTAYTSSVPPLESAATWGPGQGRYAHKQLRILHPDIADRMLTRDLDVDAHDQYVFVHNLRLSSKWPILMLKAAAIPRDLGPPDGDNDDTVLKTSDDDTAVTHKVRFLIDPHHQVSNSDQVYARAASWRPTSDCRSQECCNLDLVRHVSTFRVSLTTN